MASTIKSGNNNNFNVFSTNSSVFDSSLSNNFKLNIKEKEDDIVFVNDNTSVYQNLSIDELKQQLNELEKKSNFNSLKGLDNTQVEADIKLIRRIYEDKGNQIISIRSLDEKISDIDAKIQTCVDNNDKVIAEDLKNKKKSYEFLKSIINKTTKTYFSYEEIINDISTDVLTVCYNNNDLIFNEELFKEKYKGYEISDFYNLLIDNPSATEDPLLLFKAQKYVYGNSIETINNEFNEKKKYLQSEFLSIDSTSIDSSNSNFMMLALLSKIDSSYNDISLQELDDISYTVNDDYKMYLSQYQQYIPFLSDEEIKKIFKLSKKSTQSVNDYIFTELNITERVAKGTDVFYDNESRIKSIQTLVANEYKEKYNYVFPEEDYKKNYQNYSIAMQTEFQVESNYNFQMLQNEDFTTYLKSEDIQNILNKEHKKVENIDKYAENYDKIAYYLSDDEKKVYYYRLKKYGENNAKKYLSFLKSAVRMRAGQEEAQKRLEIFKTGEDEQGNPIYDFSKYYTVGSTAILTAMGFDDGVENFFVGLKNCFYADKEQTCFDYEKMFIMEALTSDKNKDSFFGQELAYEFGTSMGNMAPVIITSMALQAVPFIGQTAVPGLVSTIGMGASSFGNNKHDLYLQGYDGYKMYMRAAMGAMSEVALEKFLGTIPGISVVNKTAEASAVGADKNLVKFLKYILLNSAKEGIEESSQVIVDSFMDSILLGNEFSIDFEELVKSGVLGALSGGITNATTIGISKLPVNINGMKCSLETALIDKFAITNDRLLDLHYKTALAEVMTLCDENTRTSESIEKAANVMEKAGFKDVADNIRTIDIINNKNSETNNSVSQNFNESNSSVKIDENIEVLEVGNNIADNKNNNIENANAEVSIETIQTNINNADSNEISDFLANNKIDKVLEVVSNMSESEINAMVSKIPLNSYYEFYKKLGSSDIFTKLTPENLNHVTKLLYLSPKTFKLMSLNENFIEAIVKGDSSNIDTIMHADGIVELQTKLKEKMKSVNNQDVSLNDEIEIPKLDKVKYYNEEITVENVVKTIDFDNFKLNNVKKISDNDFKSESELCQSCDISELFDDTKKIKKIKIGNYELQLTNPELIDVWLNKNLKYEALDSTGKVKDFGALMYYLKKYFEINYDISLKENFYDSSFETINKEYVDLFETVNKVMNKDMSVTKDILDIVANRGNENGSINKNDFTFTLDLQKMSRIISLMRGLDNFYNSQFLSDMSYKDKVLLFKFMKSGVINTYLNMNTGELKALGVYQSNDYKDFNEYLDIKKSNPYIDMEKFDIFLSALMDKSLLKEPSVFQRATTKDEFGGIPIEQIEGKIITQNRYKSSCIASYDSIGTAVGGMGIGADRKSIPVKIDYVCPEGTKCVNLGMIQAIETNDGNLEQEALIGKNQKIRYDKVKKVVNSIGKDTYVVLATIIPDGVDENISIKDIVDSDTYDIIRKQYGIDVDEKKSNIDFLQPEYKFKDALLTEIKKACQSKYVNLDISSVSDISEVSNALVKIFNESTDPKGFYYSLVSLTGENFSDCNVKSWLLSEVIDKSEPIRKIILDETKTQVSDMLYNVFDLKDNFMQEELTNYLMGYNFVKDGINFNYDWKKFVDKISFLIKEKVNSMAQNKEFILWSKFGDEDHFKLDEKYTTIQNATIGEGFTNIDLVFPNWNQSSLLLPQLEKFWMYLSESFVDSCLSAINPNTGKNYESIRFVTSQDKNIDSCFGNIFQTVELPLLVKDGRIKNIIFTIMNPENMAIKMEHKIDISDLIEKYSDFLKQSENNISLKQLLFDEFKEKVKNIMLTNEK